MKKIFRKAMTVLGSAALIGLTVGTASAASYPTPFTSNTAIVVGANAAPSDNIAASSIASNLDANAAGGTIVVSGDGDIYKFEKSSTKFHLGDKINTMKATLDDDELPTLLASGKYIDDDNDEFDYSQEIEIPTGANAIQLTMFEDNDYIDDEPTVGFRIASGGDVLNYTISFDDEPLLGDLLSTNLKLMGKEYYVLSNTTSGGNFVMTLLDSADSAIITEGETKTITTGSKNYDVSISFVSSTEVKLIVNDETTNSLGEGDTQKLGDGSYIGIKDILYSAKDTGISKVEISIGAGKLTLTSGSEVQINDEAVSGVSVVITNSSGTTATSTLSSIEIAWRSDDDLFITEDTEITMPEFEIVTLSYGGLNYPTEEVIEIAQGSDTYIELRDFPLKETVADIPLLYGSAGGPYTDFGKDADSRLVTTQGDSLTFDKDTDEMFIVSYASGTEAESYVMRATNFVLDGSYNKTDIQYLKNGVWTTKKTVKAGDTFSIGNAELGIQIVNRTDKWINVTANSSATNFSMLYSAEGLRLYLPYNATNASATAAAPGSINFSKQGSVGHNATSFYLNFTEEDKDGNIGSGHPFGIEVGWDSSSTAEPEVSDLIGENVTNVEIQDTDVWRSFMYGELATEFLWSKPSSGQDSIKVIYHGGEVAADVYASSPEAVTTSSEAGVMTVTDTNVGSVATKNLVVVGGSAINSVAADLLGGAYREGAFTDATGVAAGQFLIQSFDSKLSSGKTALLVAGYNAADTEKATTYLLNNAVDTTVGKKYKGTSATEASLVVA